MHRLTPSLSAVLFALVVGCGGSSKPAEEPSDKGDAGEYETAPPSADEKPGNTPPVLEKKDECVGSDIPNLEEVLGKSACEEPTAKADGLTPIDLKGKLQVTAAPSPTKVAPGGRTDLLVTFANMSKEPLTLHFRIDPLPRFETETYDEKNKRVDMPAGKPPAPPKGQTPPPASEAKVAKVTISPGGTARAHVPWTGVKMKWAPEKVRGTPPERGYPRSPAGPLPKGKYTVKVLTPLIGVAESPDHDATAPKTTVELGN